MLPVCVSLKVARVARPRKPRVSRKGGVIRQEGAHSLKTTLSHSLLLPNRASRQIGANILREPQKWRESPERGTAPTPSLGDPQGCRRGGVSRHAARAALRESLEAGVSRLSSLSREPRDGQSLATVPCLGL